jgi:ABC-type transport system involved in multi-copper enzyme maturation permease subunit
LITWFGTVGYLVWQELKRNLSPVRVILLLGLGLAIAYYIVGGPSQGNPSYQLQGSLTRHGHQLAWLLPLIAGATGSSLAEDRRRGFTIMVLAKGVPRGRYLLAKVLGAAASSGLFTLLTLIGFYGIVAALWPHGRSEYPAVVTWAAGPMPTLYAASPLAHDLLVALIYLEASAALPLVSVLAGSLVANEYIAIVAPALFLILCGVALGGARELLDPMLYVERIEIDYLQRVPRALHPYAVHLYWLCFVALFTGLCHWSFVKRELA